MGKKQAYGGLDYFRIVAALMVIAIHTSPLTSVNGEMDFFATRILARIAVPFFFMVSGQFVLGELFEGSSGDTGRVRRSLKKLVFLYLGVILLYLPLGVYAGHYSNLSVSGVLKMLFFDGTFYHLWYFPACILGMGIVCLGSRVLPLPVMVGISAVLYLVGLLGDSYFGLTEQIPVLASIYEKGFEISSYTRNGIFFAPLFLLLGVVVHRRKEQGMEGKTRAYLLLSLGSFAAMTAEGLLLHHLGWQRHDSMYIFLVPVMVGLYSLLSGIEVSGKKSCRVIAEWVYILHPAMIVVIRAVSGFLHLTKWCVDNSIIHYLLVSAASFIAAYMIWLICSYFHGSNHPEGRAWIEIDKKALKQNVEFLQSKLPTDCRLMPAIKANAYGHGATLVARELAKLGVTSFCVAGVMEGVDLRRAGITGEILVLGYTDPAQFPLLKRHHLMQTVVDYEYARVLNAYGRKMHVHIGVDTGMHRLGERSENIDALCDIFKMEHLVIDGMFTHLSADDTMGQAEQDFTNAQVEAFYQVVQEIKKRGYHCPKLHLQSSYGVLNYPELSEDYARVGIALYGVLSTGEDTLKWRKDLEPVLSLKTRVVTVRDLYAGESAGYGMEYIAKENMRIATLAIGYADGLPRALSKEQGYVLIHGKRAAIIGLICMDQAIVDVSGIPDVAEGDVAVIIGAEGDEEILASDLAKACGTITNEILSRLGQRLERVVV